MSLGPEEAEAKVEESIGKFYETILSGPERAANELLTQAIGIAPEAFEQPDSRYLSEFDNKITDITERTYFMQDLVLDETLTQTQKAKIVSEMNRKDGDITLWKEYTRGSKSIQKPTAKRKVEQPVLEADNQ